MTFFRDIMDRNVDLISFILKYFYFKQCSQCCWNHQNSNDIHWNKLLRLQKSQKNWLYKTTYCINTKQYTVSVLIENLHFPDVPFSRKKSLSFKIRYFISNQCFSGKMILQDFVNTMQVYLNLELIYIFLTSSCASMKSNIPSALSMALCNQPFSPNFALALYVRYNTHLGQSIQ